MKGNSLFFYRLFILFLILSSCGSNNDTQKQRFLIRGNDALKQQNYRDAERFFKESVKIDSCYTPALNNLGITYFEQKQYNKAVLQYQQTLNCDPGYLDAYMNRSSAFYELNELYSALEDIKYVEKKIPDSSTVYFRKGLIKTKMRKFKEAVAAFDRAYILDSVNAETLVNRGSVKYYLHDLEAAEADLLAALKIAPFEANAYNALALIEEERGNHDNALNLVNKALNYAPIQPYFLNNRGFIYLQKGELAKAKADIDKSITLDPGNAWAYRNKGWYYFKSGYYEDAVRLLERAIALDEYVDNGRVFIAKALLALDREEEACVYVLEAMNAGESVGADLIKTCR